MKGTLVHATLTARGGDAFSCPGFLISSLPAKAASVRITGEALVMAGAISVTISEERLVSLDTEATPL
jgi:hypothetical protein